MLGAHVSLQLLGELSNGTLAFALVHSYNSHLHQRVCTAVNVYLSHHAVRAGGRLELEVAPNDTIDFGLRPRFLQCAHDQRALRPVIRWAGILSADLSTLLLTDNENCERVELSNQPVFVPRSRARRASAITVSNSSVTPGFPDGGNDTSPQPTAQASSVATPTSPKPTHSGRRLSSDVQTSNVCPAPPPPAPPSRYFGNYSTCPDCVQLLSLGWCSGDITIGESNYSGGCYQGTASGPQGGTCSGYVWLSSDCPVASSPPPPSPPYGYYSQFDNCWTCTQDSPRGWCSSTTTLGQTTYDGGCFEGSDQGPTGGTCNNNGWVWYPSQCANAPPPSPPSRTDVDSGTYTYTYSYYSQYITCEACVQYYGWCNGSATINNAQYSSRSYSGMCFGGDSTGPTGATCNSTEGGTWVWLSSDCPASSSSPPPPPPPPPPP